MTRTGKIAGRVAALAVGALVGTVVVFGVDELSGGREDFVADDEGLVEYTNDFGRGQPPMGGDKAEKSETDSTRPETGPGTQPPEVGADVMLAWAPGSLPAGTEARIEAMPQVLDATTVFAGLDWIHTARDAQGDIIQEHANGFAVPFEIAAVEPREYARFVPGADKDTIRGLGSFGTLLSDTSTKLRGGGAGMRLGLESSELRVTGVVSDLAANGYEALVSTPPPAHWERADRFVLAHLRRPSDREAVARKIESLLPPGEPLRARSEGENPFLRYGDAVLPQLLVKETFGEFVARDVGDGSIEIARGWIERNIRTDTVPILGEVTCHRLLFPQLKEALRDVKREGLSHAVDADSGCFSARFINSDPSGRLSHHSWGIAIDLNQAQNGFGAKPNMDMRVVDVFEDRWGFTWGGRWIIPDGMHFEWIKFP